MKKFLKSYLLTVLAFVFVFSLASCGEEIPQDESSEFSETVEVSYPEKIDIHEPLISSQLSGQCTDKEMIKAFIDMLNGCNYEKVELSEDDAKNVFFLHKTYGISEYRVNIISDYNDTFVYVASKTDDTSSFIYPTEKYRVTSGFNVTPVESLKKDPVS